MDIISPEILSKNTHQRVHDGCHLDKPHHIDLPIVHMSPMLCVRVCQKDYRQVEAAWDQGDREIQMDSVASSDTNQE